MNPGNRPAEAGNASRGAPQITSPVGSQSPGGLRKLIYDQDHRGPLSTDTIATLMALQSEKIDLLGITTVTTDYWVGQETAYALRLLELMGRTEVPVYAGAANPLLNTKEAAQMRYKLFGSRRIEAFLGAFNKDHWGPDEIKPLLPPYNKFAEIKAQPGHAAEFMIKTVRAYPHEVTIFCGGALTNLAIAAMLAPDIIPLTREVVFMGGSMHRSTSSVNVYFDAEAAKIAFRANWPKFTIVTADLAEKVHMGDNHRVDTIVERGHFPIADLFRDYEQKTHRDIPELLWFRMPDEMMMAHIIEPSIFTPAVPMYADVLTDDDGHYGDTLFWDKDWNQADANGPTAGQNGPASGAGLVDVLQDLNKDSFRELFIDLMTRPIRKSAQATSKAGA
jgi:purine nucleosidase